LTVGKHDFDQVKKKDREEKKKNSDHQNWTASTVSGVGRGSLSNTQEVTSNGLACRGGSTLNRGGRAFKKQTGMV